MIAVIDYCKGNLKSVERGLTHVGGDAHITDDPEVIRTADALVLPLRKLVAHFIKDGSDPRCPCQRNSFSRHLPG